MNILLLLQQHQKQQHHETCRLYWICRHCGYMCLCVAQKNSNWENVAVRLTQREACIWEAEKKADRLTSIREKIRVIHTSVGFLKYVHFLLSLFPVCDALHQYSRLIDTYTRKGKRDRMRKIKAATTRKPHWRIHSIIVHVKSPSMLFSHSVDDCCTKVCWIVFSFLFHYSSLGWFQVMLSFSQLVFNVFALNNIFLSSICIL